MSTRTVVKKIIHSREDEEYKFNFSQDMIKPLSNSTLPGYVRDYYNNAWKNYLELPIPTTNDEAWRRTDIKSLKVSSFNIPKVEEIGQLHSIPDEYVQPLAGENHGGQLIFTPSGVQYNVNAEVLAKGLIFTDLNTALQIHPEEVSKILGSVVRTDESKFAAMAAAFSNNGVFLYVPRGMHISQPLHSVIWGPGANLAHFSHILVYVDDGASVTYLHENASPDLVNGQTLHSGIVEIHVGSGANLRFVELQSWGSHVWNFAHERARIEQNGQIDWIFGAVGSHLTKNFTDLDLIGNGASGRMSGFYFTNGIQHLDHDTQQNHFAANTTSDLLFKGALKDKSRSVWQGMIYVAPDAQKTDGYQANRNLVLSTKARADSIPGLEILADDVRCTHGATVGKIDPDQVFYLLTRGIPYNEAERLIVEGFFDPIMERIPFEGVRMRLQEAIRDKM
jgi:Fe-S cluster assembly protein SufD